MNNEINLCKDYVFDNFDVQVHNKFAYTTSVAVAEAPGINYNPLFIGGNNKDRIHLIHAIGNYVMKHFNYNVLYITATQYIEDIKSMTKEELEDKYENVSLLIVDDIECLIENAEVQLELLELFNRLHSNNKQVVFSSNNHFDKLSNLDENLRNTITWGITINISQTDNDSPNEVIKDDNSKSFNYNWLG